MKKLPETPPDWYLEMLEDPHAELANRQQHLAKARAALEARRAQQRTRKHRRIAAAVIAVAVLATLAILILART